MSIFSRFISFVRRKTSQRYRFNLQYKGTKWECMRDIADLGRYSIIVGYTRFFCKNPRILDLGCGEGILAEKFMPEEYAYYLGVDFSDVAIANAQKLANDKMQFITGDLNKLTVTGNFDAIIYNESLNYMSDPPKAVQALLSNLSPEGVFIVSMVDKHGKEHTGRWGGLEEVLQPIEKTKLSNTAGDSWTIRVYRPKG